MDYWTDLGKEVLKDQSKTTNPIKNIIYLRIIDRHPPALPQFDQNAPPSTYTNENIVILMIIFLQPTSI